MMTMPCEKFSCDICGTSDTAQPYLEVRGIDGNEYSLVRCAACGMITVFPCPTAEFLHEFYSRNYQGKVKKGIIDSKNIQANRAPIEDGFTKLRYMQKYAYTSGGKLLDVGCGHGFFLYSAKLSGYDPTGVDIDESALNYARTVLDLKADEHNIDELSKLPQTSFDAITFWQVLEHLRSPGTCVQSAHALLREGGIVAGSVPNIGGIGSMVQGKKWYLLVPPEHINYFTEKSMRTMLTHAGFEPLFVGTIPLYASPYFSFGIRPRIMRYAQNSNSHEMKAILMGLQRSITLTKRYIIYKLLNAIIMNLHIPGNSLFFVARKQQVRH